ncbi:hypothetical protein EG327_008263 [Venturia inaequalis]|uniref:non-specific serine/threonine protein kinase n=1 Tax=Venturia inaequalis TaxID=5025 RepID=A0A8H3VSA4_VENIN|nr:hypothetical protein EG327_008263 [Venturia inaequalis]
MARPAIPTRPRRARRNNEEPDDAISGMDVKTLRAYAEAHSISLRGMTKKPQFKEAIREHFLPGEPPSPDGDDDDEEDENDDDVDRPGPPEGSQEEGDAGTTPIPDAHEKMSRAEIINIAGRHGVNIEGAKNRIEMVAAIEAHLDAEQAVIDEQLAHGLEITEPIREGSDSLSIIEPTNYGEREKEELDDNEKATSEFARREEAIRERERILLKREEDYLQSRERAIEDRERAIQEKEEEFAGRKRTIGEADPDHSSTDSRPHKRQRLEAEVAEESEKDLPRPGVPEFIERKHACLKRQRDGEDFKIKGKDVKEWYDARLITGCKADNERWVYKKNVGEGAYGSCSIWVRANDKSITDRVVLKDQIIDDHSLNRLTWTFDGFQEKPMEADLQKRLWQCNPRCFLGYRGYSYDKNDHAFRLYTEYAHYGSLKGLMDKYASNSKSSFLREDCIPEPFIWYVAQELLLAAKTMASGFRSEGSTRSDKDDENKWVEIIHMDIKPHNILMAEPDPLLEDERARKYNWPKIQVTDFGVAVELHSQWQNPQDLTGRGTAGYMAPEHYRQIRRDPVDYPVQQFSVKTNIWGIGAVLYDLMNPRAPKGSDNTGGPIREENSKGSKIGYHKDLMDIERNLAWREIAEPEDAKQKFTNRSRPADVRFINVYSKPLIKLVTECLAFRPENRVGLEEMEKTIEKNFNDWCNPLTEDHIWNAAGNLDFEREILKLKEKTPMVDEFKIGSLRI